MFIAFLLLTRHVDDDDGVGADGAQRLDGRQGRYSRQNSLFCPIIFLLHRLLKAKSFEQVQWRLSALSSS